LVLCTILLLVLSVPNPVALGVATVAAIIPAVFYSLLVIYLDRYEAEPWYTLLGAFLWGAVVAVVFSVIAQLVAGGIVHSAYGAGASEFFGLVIGAPVSEELTKGAALLVLLLLFRHEFDNTLDGIVYGALVGLGFAMTENILYFGTTYQAEGPVGFGFLFVLRAVLGGFAHALYTATTGAAIGWARAQYGRGFRRVLVPLGGITLAILLHALWNGSIYAFSTWFGDDASAWTVLLIIFGGPIFFILPGVVTAVVIAVIVNRRVLRILKEQLGAEVPAGVISPEEYAALTDARLRRTTSWRVLREGGVRRWLAWRRFNRLAADLAFQKYHASRGELGRRGLRSYSDTALRHRIIAARGRMGTVSG
jgi:RsiW-degrading membrane proteinase PrsW (M82 family)